jgi:hypothetical protein
MSGTRYNGLSITCHVIATSSIDSIKDYPLKGQVLTLCLKSTHNTYFITLAFHLYSFSFFIFTESTTRSQAQQPPARHRTCSSATSPAALVLSQPIAWRPRLPRARRRRPRPRPSPCLRLVAATSALPALAAAVVASPMSGSGSGGLAHAWRRRPRPWRRCWPRPCRAAQGKFSTRETLGVGASYIL